MHALRLTVKLPCIVAFTSATYRVRLIHCVPSGRHDLAGYDHAAVQALIGPDYRSRDALEAAVFQAGLPVRIDTIGATILRKMGREGPAVVVGCKKESAAPLERGVCYTERAGAADRLSTSRAVSFEEGLIRARHRQ